MSDLKHFYLDRIEDATGVSGTGRVAEGFVFEDGIVALRWLTEHRSTALYSSVAEVRAIHLHHGATKITRAPRFNDEERKALECAEAECEASGLPLESAIIRAMLDGEGT